ncbi:alkene reductase [Rhodococcoides kroppenstedtii]|uniref:alkene reductase n=1 Tax=Rhodococcoides kroppenstedtii TaxID=293050 RepID=UPI00352FF5C5
MTELGPDSPILQPLDAGAIATRNRVWMAPLTRNRSEPDGTPNDLNVEYYRQRAGAGLIVSEGTQPSAVGKGYLNTPGIHTDEQQAGWARIADAVHGGGGRIVVQLMHAGRVSHPDNTGEESVAPSAIAPGIDMVTASGEQPIPTPRALETDELPGIVAEFVDASRRAIAAGLDGVEIHAANGYLLHQFLADGANTRTDTYGGSPENRARLVVEVTRAVADAIGAGHVGIRISPGSTASGIAEDDTTGAYEALLDGIDGLGLAYLHALIAPDDPFLGKIRSAWSGALVLNTGFEKPTTRDDAVSLVTDGVADAVTVGRPFIANPDLVTRWTHDTELNTPDESTFYGGGAEGYTDYPTLEG